MIEIIDYLPAHKAHFKDINIRWIRQYFAIEPADLKMLDDPEGYVIGRGGHIFMATNMGNIVGTCALLNAGNDVYELAKMGVDMPAQGLGAGLELGRRAIAKAQELGCKRLFLESNRILVPALSLYRKLGFVEVPTNPNTPYQRCDIAMEIIF
jgi:GNAT superfamily N-acetyltransferase